MKTEKPEVRNVMKKQKTKMKVKILKMICKIQFVWFVKLI